ncbi:MAG: hypothetical protein NTW86_16675 [Candidatus Sumerlaeota bacterium]|nr:hypothetical protein [Candidatus Sumerlaeota bacterium]
MSTPARNAGQGNGPSATAGDEVSRLMFFSELAKRPVFVDPTKRKVGKLADIVFRLAHPYPEAVGIYIEHGWGKPTEFIRWDQVIRIAGNRIWVQPPEGETFPPFVDQKGWILIDKHLMGRTVVDMDGRRTEVVNDVHLLETRFKLFLVHVDVSLNGFLRRIGLKNVKWIKDQLISWRYVQPLSVEDAAATDHVSLSITRDRVKDLPSEDLADILEELSGEEQQALFSALDTEDAADALVEAEPRAQRQIVANLRKERARAILTEMSIPQLANLFSVLPHDDVTELLGLLPGDQAERIRAMRSEREVTARALMSTENATRRRSRRQQGRPAADVRQVSLPHDPGGGHAGPAAGRDSI